MWENPLYFGHISLHSNILGPLSEGNIKADDLVSLSLVLETNNLKEA